MEFPSIILLITYQKKKKQIPIYVDEILHFKTIYMPVKQKNEKTTISHLSPWGRESTPVMH